MFILFEDFRDFKETGADSVPAAAALGTGFA